MPAVECCVQLIHSILCTVLWTKYLVTQAVPARYQTCFAQAQIDLAFHTPATVGSWLSRWSGVVEEHDLETIFWGWCGRFPSLSSFDRFFWQEEPLWRLIFEAGEAGRGAPVQVRALEQWMIPNKLENVI